ncbi:MAG: hypothetical protein AAGJ35_12875, partial [Myxococcota bacterium]
MLRFSKPSLLLYGFFGMFLALSWSSNLGCTPSTTSESNAETSSKQSTEHTETTPDASEPDETSVDTSEPESASQKQSPELKPQGLTLENVIERAATSVCRAMLRCCNPKNQELLFQTYRNSNREEYKKLLDQIPPNAKLTQSSCVPLMKKIYEAGFLGSWLNAARKKRVTFVPQAAKTCLETLDNTTCGQSLFRALVDSTCFGEQPPSGGTQQRKIFVRESTIGKACTIFDNGTRFTYCA